MKLVFYNLVLLLVFLIFSCRKDEIPVDSGWKISIFQGSSLSDLKPSGINPVLNADSVTDMSAGFVADPFIFKKENTWYLFFEIMDNLTAKASIGYAVSYDNCKNWNYRKVILNEPWHLSFPQVFEFEQQFYLIPEACQSNSTILYKAGNFPEDWTMETRILNIPLRDPVIFRENGTWYLFGTNEYDLCLFFSPTLKTGWKEHPASPIVKGDKRYNRAGGNVFFDGYSYFRIAQDDKDYYGQKIHIFKILKINTKEYSERLISDNPNLSGGKYSWAKRGMHTLNAQFFEDKRIIAAVDGN
jgi:hypothetical protein